MARPANRRLLAFSIGVDWHSSTERVAGHGEPPGMDAQYSRVCLVHDWLTGMRGGEKCLERLCRRWPHAPIYTLLHAQGSVSPLIENHQIATSVLQRLP